MKKDKYGTIVTASRKAPYGYGLCGVCQHPNVSLNERGQIAVHGASQLRFDRCPGSLSVPANVGGRRIYVLDENLSADPAQPIWSDRFCFLASSPKAAEDDARRWARYHGHDPADVDVRLAPVEHINSEDLHDDWIPR